MNEKNLMDVIGNWLDIVKEVTKDWKVRVAIVILFLLPIGLLFLSCSGSSIDSDDFVEPLTEQSKVQQQTTPTLGKQQKQQITINEFIVAKIQNHTSAMIPTFILLSIIGYILLVFIRLRERYD